MEKCLCYCYFYKKNYQILNANYLFLLCRIILFLVPERWQFFIENCNQQTKWIEGSSLYLQRHMWATQFLN